MRILFLLLVTLSLALSSDLSVVIRGVDTSSGPVYIGLYNDANYFMAPGHEFRKALVDPVSEVIEGTFPNLPLGNSYAIFVYQAVDSSAEFLVTRSGNPRTTYAFSHHTRDGLQSFHRSAFILRRSDTINLYLRAPRR